MFEWVAAVLLLVGSAAIIRAVMAADRGAGSETTAREARSAAEDFRQAA